MESNLYNENIGACLIGSILKQPQLLTLPQYPLEKSDFAPCKLHQILYICATRLARAGIQEITEIEVENVVKNHPAQYEILQDNNYFEFIYTAKQLAIIDNFEFYYNTIRKFSLLRELKTKGYSIAPFYDELGDEKEQASKLEKKSIQDIVNYYELDAIELRNKYDVKYVRNEITVGEDTETLIEHFEDKPSFGALLCSPFLSSLINGFNRGNLIMRSAPSGANKSRMAVSDMCGLCVDQYYDYTANDFVDNPNYQGPGLFIHTELDTVTEMQPMFLACVSGVPSSRITLGQLTDEEKLRVLKAGEILKKNNFTLTDMPDFTSKSIKRKIKEKVENDGVMYVNFDYMMLNGPLSFEYKNNTGVQAQEHAALRSLATDLKDYAETMNVGILTASQLNGNEKTMDFPDESCISSSRSIKNKLDAGFIMLPTKERKKEIKVVEPLIQQYAPKGVYKEKKDIYPNRITYVYKARFGLYSEEKIKIFHKFDAGTMRNIDYFCCDAYNEFVNIPMPQFC